MALGQCDAIPPDTGGVEEKRALQDLSPLRGSGAVRAMAHL